MHYTNIINDDDDENNNEEDEKIYNLINELYEFRTLYNAALFNEWAIKGIHDVHKSWRHNDGKLCFDDDGGWFIVLAMLPDGNQISNHYPAKDFHLFRIPETDTAKFPFDGHTSSDVINRLKNFVKEVYISVYP